MTRLRYLAKAGVCIRPILLTAILVVAVAGAAGTGTTDANGQVGTTHLYVQAAGPMTQVLAEGLGEVQGSTIGPDGALYVTANQTGEIWRVDPNTGATTLFASGLWARAADPYHIGSGIVDVTFQGETAYALVTTVGPEFGADPAMIAGIYRVDDPTSNTRIADIGAWSVDNPPDTAMFIPTGFQFAIQTFRDGFLVTDGHHNRVLWVTTDGEITELIAFDNVVPTGLAVSGDSIYVAQAGPLTHEPEDGKVVVFDYGSSSATEVAAGAPLLVDVEFGDDGTLYALAQGDWGERSEEKFDGLPAMEDTGFLVRADGNGGFDVLVSEVDRPTSFEIIGNSAYIVTLDGEIWRVDNLAGL